MTREQAKTEIMQIYGSLSEEKKKALDVAFKAMEQADNIPVMYYPQVDGITPTVVAQADGKFKMRDATPEEQEAIDKYIKSISKPTGVNFWDLADGEYISKQVVLNTIDKWYEDKADIEDLIVKITYMLSVAIPPEHDGCKDCVYQANPEDAMPCRECKQNYMDKWKAIPSAEPCEDAISRQAVNNLQKYRYNCGDTSITCISLKSVNDLPPIRPQEKTGHREYNDIYDHYLCENCKTIVMDYDNFCPNCGTRMIEPQESEEV